MDDQAKQKDFIRSWIILVVACLLAWGLNTLTRHEEAHLRAFRERGRKVEVTITRVSRTNGSEFVDFTYEIDGKSYQWDAKSPQRAWHEGDRVAGTYLAEAPDKVRLAPLDDATIAEEAGPFRKFGWLLLFAGLFLFFVRIIVRNSLPMKWVGWGIGGILLAAALGANFDPAVAQVQARAFGERPLGLPVTTFVCLAELVLLGPALFVLGPSLLMIAQELRRTGSVRKTRFLAVILLGKGLTGELRVARIRALVSGLYLIALMVAWIAFAESRGI